MKRTAPVNFSGRVEKALIDLGVDGFKSRKAFDLWGLLAAHPARADLAAHEAELKGLLKELAAPGLKFDEGIDAQKTVVTAPLGAFALADLKYQLGGANAGPQSSITFSVSAEGLSLPVGLIRPTRARSRPRRSTSRRRSRASTSPRPRTNGSPTSASRATGRSCPTTTPTRSRPLS